MKLLKDYIQVEVKGTLKESNIIIPGTVEEKQRFNFTFKVINVGEDVKHVKVGDSILLAKYHEAEGEEVIKDSETYKHIKIITKEEYVIAIL